ncbi:MAG TPA: enoyl-CoA hydratase-related protein [Planctomycetota bacterium]|nr:enoyl-CoA hydratase-related protein [Planctomycetota bacterium]
MSRVRYEVDRGVAVLTLDEAPANAYSYEMMQDLDAAILRARFDENVHVLVLTGAGEKFFCAGADVRTLQQVTPEYKYYFCLHANETLCRLEQTPKLVLAALNGHTVGGGLEVALACDLRLARKDGGKLGVPEVALGVLPGTGGTQRLVRLVGKSAALRLMAEGRNLTFDEGRELGLVDQVLPGDRAAFLDAVLAYARTFAPPAKASRAVGRIKRAVVSGAEMSFADGLALERELQQQLFLGEDAREGMAAFVEKRPPQFKGR